MYGGCFNKRAAGVHLGVVGSSQRLSLPNPYLHPPSNLFLAHSNEQQPVRRILILDLILVFYANNRRRAKICFRSRAEKRWECLGDVTMLLCWLSIGDDDVWAKTFHRKLLRASFNNWETFNISKIFCNQIGKQRHCVFKQPSIYLQIQQSKCLIDK